MIRVIKKYNESKIYGNSLKEVFFLSFFPLDFGKRKCSEYKVFIFFKFEAIMGTRKFFKIIFFLAKTVCFRCTFKADILLFFVFVFN